MTFRDFQPAGTRSTRRGTQNLRCRSSPGIEGFNRSRALERSNEPCDRRAQVRLGSVPEFRDEWMSLERLLDDAPLHALSTAVNQAHLTEARLVSGVHVLLDH
jgi:hypothetical protein